MKPHPVRNDPNHRNRGDCPVRAVSSFPVPLDRSHDEVEADLERITSHDEIDVFSLVVSPNSVYVWDTAMGEGVVMNKHQWRSLKKSIIESLDGDALPVESDE